MDVQKFLLEVPSVWPEWEGRVENVEGRSFQRAFVGAPCFQVLKEADELRMVDLDAYYLRWIGIRQGILEEENLCSAVPIFFGWWDWMDSAWKRSPSIWFEEACVLATCATSRMRTGALILETPKKTKENFQTATRSFAEAAFCWKEIEEQVLPRWLDVAERESSRNCRFLTRNLPRSFRFYATGCSQFASLVYFLEERQADSVFPSDIVAQLATGIVQMFQKALEATEEAYADKWRFHIRAMGAFFRGLRGLALSHKVNDSETLLALSDGCVSFQRLQKPVPSLLQQTFTRTLNDALTIYHVHVPPFSEDIADL